MSDDPQPVVLLHGLGRTRAAMFPLALHLKKRGYRAINVGYFGAGGLKGALAQVTRSLEKLLKPYVDRPIHFVTHSMGGMVARAYLHARAGGTGWAGRGRLVQLAPPNQGAWLADAVRRVPLLDHVPAFFDLGNEHGQGPLRYELPAVEAGYEVGVIAGLSFGPWHGQIPSDGVVRVAETYLPEARDWILLEHFHTIVMSAKDTWANVDAFLEEGRFLPDASRLELGPQGGVRIQAVGSGTSRDILQP